MASKRHRRLPTKMTDRPRKDKVTTARKAQLEAEVRKEAEMEARGVFPVTKTVTVTCPRCQYVQQFELENRVPIMQCGRCANRLAVKPTGFPQVVSR